MALTDVDDIRHTHMTYTHAALLAGKIVSEKEKKIEREKSKKIIKSKIKCEIVQEWYSTISPICFNFN